ncbi:Peroxidase 60 [Bienertia sinuspersici]
MMRREKSSTVALALGLIVMTLIGQSYSQLTVGFYAGKCKGKKNANANADADVDVDVEQLIFDIVESAFKKHPTLVAAMLRMLFHDCFVGGCDASILLDGAGSEKTAGPNETVRGYKLIDAVKSAVEKRCRGVVSCADIIVIVTRATVFLASGNWYDVKTGRRDGSISSADLAMLNLPPPDEPVPSAIAKFQAKNLTVQDFVLLMGGHTVGISHCKNFRDRLYNYKGVPGMSDPNIPKDFLEFLKQTCPEFGSSSNSTVLDQFTPNLVDNGFYKAIGGRKGVLQIDQDIALDPVTSPIVSKLANNSTDFIHKFGVALNNLAEVGVLTGSQGQIRKFCRFVN